MFHINFETGEINKCHAKIQCPFDSIENHFSSKEEARAFYEKSQKSRLYPSIKVKTSQDFITTQPVLSSKNYSVLLNGSKYSLVRKNDFDDFYEKIDSIRIPTSDEFSEDFISIDTVSETVYSSSLIKQIDKGLRLIEVKDQDNEGFSMILFARLNNQRWFVSNE